MEDLKKVATLTITLAKLTIKFAVITAIELLQWAVDYLSKKTEEN